MGFRVTLSFFNSLIFSLQTSLAVKWLRLPTSNAGSGSTPVWETKITYRVSEANNKKRRKSKDARFFVCFCNKHVKLIKERGKCKL